MVKRQSPRILAASALAALVVGLSACGTPQTLVPYTPAHGVNVDAPRMGATEADNEVPLKVRNLLIVSEPDSGEGYLSGTLYAPNFRADELVSVDGVSLTSDNTPGAPIPAVTANLELPAGQTVVLTDQQPIELVSAGIVPGLVAELTLTFADSEAQTLLVPVMSSEKSEYETVEPGAPAEDTEASPAAEAAEQDDAEQGDAQPAEDAQPDEEAQPAE